MTSEDVIDDFDQVLDTVQQLVGGSNNSSTDKTIDADSNGKQDSAEEKWKNWKNEHLQTVEESVAIDHKDEEGSLTGIVNTEISHEEDLSEEKVTTEDLATSENVQGDSSLDQDINGNPDLVLRLDSSIDFEEEKSFNKSDEDAGKDENGCHQLADGGMIELSACGTVDPVVLQDFDDLDEAIIVKEDDGNSVCDMIDLSSDEETEGSQDVSVVLLKRPPVQQIANEVADDTIQIDDSDDEFPIFLDEAEKQENFNVEEKRGYVKDFIEREGLGIIYAE